MKNTPLISIILPIYNVEKYLSKCLDSIIHQTYENLEIILVDDGSTDACPEICDKYAKQDSRIKVIHQENMDVSGARNTGLANVSGEYISFIDPDDYVAKDYIGYLFQLLKDNQCDMAICGMTFVYEDGASKTKINSIETEILNSFDALEFMLYQKKINNSPCAKLYKRELFDGIIYPLNKRYEDLGTTYKLIMKCNTIVIGNQPYYYYFQSKNSIVRSEFNSKTLDILDMVYQLEKDVLKVYPNLINAVQSRILNANFFVIRQLPKKKYKNEYYKIKENIKLTRIDVLKDPKSRLKTKLGILVSFFGISMLKLFYSLLNRVYFVKKLD